MEPEDCDTASARLILRLESEDIAAALRNSTDPAEFEWLNTRAAIVQMQLQELDDYDTFQADQRMQRSVTQAMLSDFLETDAILREETAGTPQIETTAQYGRRVDGQNGYYEDNRVDPSGSTTLAAYMEALRLEELPRRECYICMADAPYTQTTEVGNCNHIWCRGCLREMFDLATKNESNYPIRCCGEVPIIALDNPGVALLVGAETIAAVQAKVVEYETEDKTYCHDPRCSSFIPPTTINENRATCAGCQKNTCAGCKAEFHGEEDCNTAKDEAFAEWQRDNEAATCRTCRRVIIISHGCNHMRCFCGAEFCYECGEPWKSCRCEHWHETRLLERAAVFAGRQGQNVNAQDVVEELRNEADCRHTNWTRVLMRIDPEPHLGLERDIHIVHICRERDVSSKRSRASFPNKQVHTPGMWLFRFLRGLYIVDNTVIRPFDFAGQEQGAVARPGDVDFFSCLDPGDFDLDKVFFDGVADVDIWLVWVVF